jgi:hypothetical protein
MDDPIRAIEDLLDATARRCLRLIGTETLTAAQYKSLSKWMYGCSNQRYTIRRRVEKHGSQELGKVLKFIAKACQVIVVIEESFLADDDPEEIE